MFPCEIEPEIIQEILVKQLSNGAMASFALVHHMGEYKAMLFLNGKSINGPPLPEPLTEPKGDITHWMGNKPGVGLTTSQAEKIIDAVKERNERIRH